MVVTLDILTPERALVFRITHKNNLPWILDNGLHCASSTIRDPNFVQIGNADIIDKRRQRDVTVAPYGVLSDYVPFYFTPKTPMMLNIATGRNVTEVERNNIVILVSSHDCLAEHAVQFVLTDRNARLEDVNFFPASDTEQFNSLDWENWRNSDFKRDPGNPEKIERYQAETLAHRHVPVHALLGFACYDDDSMVRLSALIEERNLELPVRVREGYYV